MEGGSQECVSITKRSERWQRRWNTHNKHQTFCYCVLHMLVIIIEFSNNYGMTLDSAS